MLRLAFQEKKENNHLRETHSDDQKVKLAVDSEEGKEILFS